MGAAASKNRNDRSPSRPAGVSTRTRSQIAMGAAPSMENIVPRTATATATATAAEANEEEKTIAKKMKVFVVVPRPDRGRVALEVSRDDTVASVKARLHELVGIQPSRQRLVFARLALPDDDDTTLAGHGVADSATIQLVETKMNVFVRMERTLLFSDVESSDTVESFRLRIQEREGMGLRPAQQRLIHRCAQLEDGHTLGDYGVRNCSTLHFVIRLARMRTRVVELDIDVTDTVGRIKERVEEADGVPVECQSICFRGIDLDDNRTLAHYDALETGTWVKIGCRRHESGGTTMKKAKTKGEEPVVTQEIPTARRRRFTVYLVGPELAPLHPSSCDSDPEL